MLLHWNVFSSQGQHKPADVTGNANVIANDVKTSKCKIGTIKFIGYECQFTFGL